MKQMTCAQMGGPADCTFSVTSDTAENMVEQGFAHIQQAHPDLAKEIMEHPAEENDKWMQEFKTKFETWPEM
ncbi:MAG: hypothetical protein HY918_05895 [Candidatus Doudnabacteria bacterium]|nr:hypothetical protein [Candidatus Doudnabacteria bacterium]